MVALQASAAGHPNVLFIISDDLSAEALACYGNTQCQTPNIDAIAQSGTLFSRAYTQYPVCGPSRAALMSGMYPQSNGVTGNGSAHRFTEVMGDRPSMSQHFIQNGYYAASVSKIYHMLIPGNITDGKSGDDHTASWNDRYYFRSPEWMTPGPYEHLSKHKLNKDPDTHYGLGFGSAFYVVKADVADGSDQNDVMAANKAIEILRQQKKDQPFFLALGLIRPHVPLVAPAHYYDLYPPDEMILPPKIEGDWDDIPKLGRSGNSDSYGIRGKLDNQRKILAAYYASVTFMDDQVGRVVDELDRLGFRDNTIVVFTSDHGYHMGEHDFWQKMSLHEESARIPLIIDTPKDSGAIATTLAQQIDIYPTLAELAGLSIPEHVQGKSLAPVFVKPEAQIHESVYCLKGTSHLLRTDRYAYMQHKDGTAELYDMKNDPKQFTNLADVVKHHQTVKKLGEQLKAKLETVGP
jgi:arylsulfatase A-like enzyme